MTQEFLQDAIVEDLKQLFSHYTLTNSLGVERAVDVYKRQAEWTMRARSWPPA